MSQDYITWTYSNSPYAPVTRVRVPEGICLPAVGVWQKVKAAGETIYLLDPSQSVDGWLAWATRSRLLRANPQDGVRPVEEAAGNHYDLLVAYVRPGTALSLGSGYKRRQRVNLVILGPGEMRRAEATDFAGGSSQKVWAGYSGRNAPG